MDQNIIRGKGICTLSGGTVYSGSTYNVTMSVYDSILVDGGKYLINASTSSYESTTLNINGLGAKPIYKPGLVQINYGDIIADRWYEVIYNQSLDAFEINLPKIIMAQYDFSVLAGAVGNYDLTSDIPTGIILKPKEGTIQTLTNATSGGLSLLTWGTSVFSNIIDAQVPFTDNRYHPSSMNELWKTKGILLYGSLEITAGAAGTIDTVTVAGVNILNGTVAYSTSLTVTASNVCKNINSNPTNNIRALNSGAVIYLYLDSLDKFNTYAMAVSATATTMTVGNFNDFGSLGNVASNECDSYLQSGNAKIRFNIAGADLTAGKFRVYIPYEINR